MVAARYGATAEGAAQLEVFLTGTARTRQCFGESDPARDRDSRLYNLNGLPARWPCRTCPVAAAQYGATAAGAGQLEVVMTGTARTRQCFGESQSDLDPARDRDSGLCNGPLARWPCPVAAVRYSATAEGAAQLEVFLTASVSPIPPWTVTADCIT